MRLKNRPSSKPKYRPPIVANFGWMLAGSGLMLAAGTAIGLWHSGNHFFDNLATLLNNRQPEPKVETRSVVLQQVREASELTTAIYTMEAVVPTQQDATVSGFVVGTTKLLYIARGEVRAGVDLSQLSESSVTIEGDTVRLKLPQPRIIDQKIDVAKSSVYDYSRGFMGLGPDVAPTLQQLAQQEALKKIRTAACTDGILQRANDRAKLVVGQMVKITGYQKLTVETQAPPANACTPT